MLTPEEQETCAWGVKELGRDDPLLAIIRRLDARLVLADAEIDKLRNALVRAAEMMLAEAKNDVTGEYSSPAIRALRAARAEAHGIPKQGERQWLSRR